jgi:hypothetical protein
MFRNCRDTSGRNYRNTVLRVVITRAFGLVFISRKTYSPTRPLLILTNRNKSWTHVIICDHFIGVLQWLIRLPALRAGVQYFNGSFDFLLSCYYFVYSPRAVLSTLYTKSIIIVDFNMRTRSSICECMLFTRTRSKVNGCTLSKHTRSI